MSLYQDCLKAVEHIQRQFREIKTSESNTDRQIVLLDDIVFHLEKKLIPDAKEMLGQFKKHMTERKRLV